MAEILIQRRQHRNGWPWLLGLLALALLPLPFLGADRDNARPRRASLAQRDTTARRDTAAGTVVPVPGVVAAGGATTAVSNERTTASAAGAVAPDASASMTPGAVAAPAGAAPAPNNEFQRFIASRDPNPDERRHRDFTADALRRLASELRVLGASDAGVRTIRANADSLQSTGARSSAHPDQTRAAFLSAVRELDVLRARHRGAAVDTARLRAAAWAIRPNERLVAQRSRVLSFFESAGDAVQSLSRAGRRGKAR